MLLNGPSSSGKTTLAEGVVARLATPWLVLPVDLFHAVRSRPDLTLGVELDEAGWQQVFRRTRAAYHRALVGAVAAGCDVIGDHVLSEPWRLDDLLALTVGQDVLLIHVTCAPEELERRERERGDRDVGTAETQLGLVFAHDDSDLTVDTTDGVEAAVHAVVDLITQPPSSRAFDRLRARRA